MNLAVEDGPDVAFLEFSSEFAFMFDENLLKLKLLFSFYFVHLFFIVVGQFVYFVNAIIKSTFLALNYTEKHLPNIYFQVLQNFL